MDSPEEAAMLGFSPASRARVAACEVVGHFAAVYVVANDPTGTTDTLSILQRRGSSWHELAGGGAGATWIGFPDDGTEVDDHWQAGVLAYPGAVNGPGAVDVELDGRIMSLTHDGYWIALFVGVDANAMDRIKVRATSVGTDPGLVNTGGV